MLKRPPGELNGSEASRSPSRPSLEKASSDEPSSEEASSEEPSPEEPSFEERGSDGPPFVIVALGASAGGLQSLEEFLDATPPDSGMAFVVVGHQHVGQPSLLSELMARRTQMPVVELWRPTAPERNRVYTIRPGYDVSMVEGVLKPKRFEQAQPVHLPVDHFFSSLARACRKRAVGIVLSGTGTDGSLGVEEIKSHGGLVLVQDEHSAQYSGMPRSAVATGLVDYVLPASNMPQQLLKYARALDEGVTEHESVEPSPEVLHKLFALIRTTTGHDFSQYKLSTVCRRIERRLHAHRLDGVEAYRRRLAESPQEIDLLVKDLLIGVTSFFRDPPAWVSLSASLARQVAGRPAELPLRAWVAGCSSGQEAYSLAIALCEVMDGLGRTPRVQIFATDLSASAIEVARAGVYPMGIANELSPERLSRFFAVEADTYRVRKEIREMIVFAPQNVISDPPFTKLDVLTCRNLLIYLDASLQSRLLPIFHYALGEEGLLMLGSSESIGSFGELFSVVDKKWNIFRRSGIKSRGVELPPVRGNFRESVRGPSGSQSPKGRNASIDQVVSRLLLEEVVPPTLFVYDNGDVVHVHGRTGMYLEPAQGAPSRANIFDMAREGLRLGLASALRRAAASGEEVLQCAVQVRTAEGAIALDLRAKRVTGLEPLKGLYRISFERARRVSGGSSVAPPENRGRDRLSELEMEVRQTQESHQGTIEELETSNEELMSSNEELMSTNEELQSVNEELETSKEEMQSLNEELQTVNSELQAKVDELSRTNNDMRNLLNATDIATIFLDEQLRIKRYTAPATKVVRLIPTDVGRPIRDLASTLRYDDISSDASRVLGTLTPHESEVQGENGERYLMRILPYRTTDNLIDGLVLTFVDVSKIRALQTEQERLLNALEGSPVGMFEQDEELRYTWTGTSLFGRERAKVIGKSDAEIFSATESLAALKRQVLVTGTPQRARISLVVGDEQRSYDLYVAPKRAAPGHIVGLCGVAMETASNE